MDIFSIECFLAIAETESFTKGAARVNRTQSAITQQISKMERTLGVTLFDRGRKCTLTTEGEIFRVYALKIYQLHQELMDRFQTPNLAGEVRFGLPEDFATVFLSDVLFQFSRIHPNVSLHVECDFTLNLYKRFKEKEFDMVVVKLAHPEDFPNGVEVWSEALAWVKHPRLISSPNSKEAVPLVLSPPPCVNRNNAIQALESASLQSNICYTSTSYAGTIAAVKAGMGFTVLPKTLIPEDLVIAHDTWLPPLPDLHVSLLCHKQTIPAVESLKKFLLEKLI